MPKYDQLTQRLARFLLGDKKKGRPPLIDPYEGGIRKLIRGRWEPRPMNLKWQIEDKRHGHPKRFSRTHLAEHLRGAETYYYRSHRGGGQVLIMIDVDAHLGQRDAGAVAEAIEQFYLPGCYHEPSTNGVGRHVYAVVRFDPYTQRRRVNRWLKGVSVALAELMKEQGFQANVCGIYGTFTEWEVDPSTGTRVITENGMGGFGKLPQLPNGDRDMDRLEAAPVYAPDALNEAVRDYKRLRERRTGRSPTPWVAVADGPAAAKHETRRRVEGLFRGMDPQDPRSRATHAVMHLARELGRLPSVEESRSFYEAHGLATVHTGGDRAPEVRRRERRLDVAIEFVGRTFDPAKTMGQKYHPEVLLPIIRQHVRPEHLAAQGLSYKKEINEEDLAIALYVIERSSFDRKADRSEQWTCGKDRIIEMFATLKAAGVTARGGKNPNKAVSCRRVLERAGLAEMIDGSYVIGSKGAKTGTAWDSVGVKGRCRRWVVGHRHPRRAEWAREYEEIGEWVLTGRRTAPTTGRQSAVPVGGVSQ